VSSTAHWKFIETLYEETVQKLLTPEKLAEIRDASNGIVLDLAFNGVAYYNGCRFSYNPSANEILVEVME
jgi:hypothetical protein